MCRCPPVGFAPPSRGKPPPVARPPPVECPPPVAPPPEEDPPPTARSSRAARFPLALLRPHGALSPLAAKNPFHTHYVPLPTASCIPPPRSAPPTQSFDQLLAAVAASGTPRAVRLGVVLAWGRWPRGIPRRRQANAPDHWVHKGSCRGTGMRSALCDPQVGGKRFE